MKEQKTPESRKQDRAENVGKNPLHSGKRDSQQTPKATPAVRPTLTRKHGSDNRT